MLVRAHSPGEGRVLWVKAEIHKCFFKPLLVPMCANDQMEVMWSSLKSRSRQSQWVQEMMRKRTVNLSGGTWASWNYFDLFLLWYWTGLSLSFKALSPKFYPSSCHFPSMVVWVSPQPGPETRICVQVLNFRGEPRKQMNGSGKCDRKEKSW